MALYRLYPEKDAWITDAHPENSTDVRATGSNHGRSPSLNVFARKGDINSSSIELARTLVQFSVTELSGLVFDEGLIPSSSVSYVLRMFNMETPDTLPESFDITAYPVSQSWDEGTGLDDDNHLDLGYVSWMDANSTTAWTTSGSDFLTTLSSSQHFELGPEDLELDVTEIVNAWLTGGLDNNGLLLKMSDANETNGENYYRKAFHARETLFIDRLPYLEARWNSVVKDHRQNFGYDVSNTLVFYNNVRGDLTTLTGPVNVQIKDSLVEGSASYSASFSAAEISTGIFTASVNLSSTGSYSGSVFYDIWDDNGAAKITGSFTPRLLTGSDVDVNEEYVVNVNNLKRIYSVEERARLVVNVKKRDFVTHVGVISTGSADIEKECIEKMYYSVINETTGENVISFGTGSVPYTQLSYNKSGNYFDLWMRSFVPGFTYRLLFLLDVNNDKQVIDDGLVFKVQ